VRSGQIRDERGAAALVQLVFVTPALIFVVMLIVQFALFAHAKSLVEASAEEGAAVARRSDGTEAGAQAESMSYLERQGRKMLTSRSVSASRTADTATVTVSGSVLSVVPGFHLRVKETASGPVERYVPPVEQAP
jgi:Flp pilus assembly protein TadG